MTLFPELLQKLEKENASDIVVFGGGIIPKDDISELKKVGVKEVFVPGTHTQDVITWIRTNVLVD
jgi:methylmalonyl-CoA mutase C-terminal domain/subunit